MLKLVHGVATDPEVPDIETGLAETHAEGQLPVEVVGMIASEVVPRLGPHRLRRASRERSRLRPDPEVEFRGHQFGPLGGVRRYKFGRMQSTRMPVRCRQSVKSGKLICKPDAAHAFEIAS